MPVEKDWLVELIDDALIDEQLNKELKKLLEKNIITLGGQKFLPKRASL
ncbi:MAG: hypothetical protein NDF55_03500 [archaeon GB-1867-005]|nr:hypothetical protein [Candidatus Culexmicrobium cathedralense]